MSDQYKQLLKDIIDNGIDKSDRTGVGTRSIFGRSMSFDLSKGFPAGTLRKVSLRIAFEETMFFLRGQSDSTILENKNINIWKGNTSREFLDSRGLNHLPVGSIGRGYGVQWRNWKNTKLIQSNDSVKINEHSTFHYNSKVNERTTDQLVELINGLTNDPNGRRHIITSWNPGELDQMALPPCHILQQYSVNNGKLDSYWLQRSVDSVYGLPYNIMSYALLNNMFAKLLKLEPGTLTFFGGDIHIYSNQMDMAVDMVSNREPFPLPTLVINKELNSLDDLLSLEYTDLELINYKAHKDYKDKPPMAV